jgi:SAM-dependent methyltransferase
MIGYANVSNMLRYINEKRLWAQWQYVTRCWEYPWILENGRFEKGLKCLDAGCGQSPLPLYLSDIGCDPHGLDYLQGEKNDYPDTYGIPQDWIKMLKGKVQYHHGTMFDVPFADRSFDRITCVSVLEHILSPQQPHAHYPCLAELKRILKPGGLLIVTVDYFTNPDIIPGYDYRDDIAYLDMPPLERGSHQWTREEIVLDEDAFFVPPELYLKMGYGEGFNQKIYHRITSVGFILQKPNV